ncbi:glucose-6-phosphate isomerase [Deltaproteobacteria bacterium Smac51]|nr:glucose-6-phosphate isomerase [Deltaproteobacteria bacterium Smac51]
MIFQIFKVSSLFHILKNNSAKPLSHRRLEIGSADLRPAGSSYRRKGNLMEKKNGDQKAARQAPLVTLDYNNLMADVIGEAGLTETDLSAIRDSLNSAVKNVENQYKKGGLAFMDLPFKNDDVKKYQALADKYKKFENVVVLGIGGSALGTKAIFNALRPMNHNSLPAAKRGWPRLFVADNIDPEGFNILLDSLDIRKTVFNVISKSGATAETMSQFLIIYDRLKRDLGKTTLKDHLLITTDPSGGVLRKIVDSQDLSSLEVPPGVGGRFSVMTAVGLAPLAMAGVDIAGLLAGAAACQNEPTDDVMANKAALFAGLNWYLTTKKKRGSMVMMPYADSLEQVADWFGQLWNESLGKAKLLNGKDAATGQTAIKALGATDQHSQLQLYMEGPKDKTICFLRTESFRNNINIPKIFEEHPELAYLGGHSMGELLNFEQKGTARALAASGRPNLTLSMPQVTPASVGYLLHMLEVATVISGVLYKIDPLDQPGVELGKKYTYGLMGRDGFDDFKASYEKGLGNHAKFILP